MPQTVRFNETQIDRIFSSLDQCHLPGVAVGIAIDGTPIYRKGFGLANLEVPFRLSPTIKLRIGSVTKQFTALTYMLLCEDRKAALDDNIGKFLPELPHFVRSVTARQLLTNTSCIRDVYELAAFNDPYDHDQGPSTSISSHDLFELYCSITDFNARPGGDWIYNNGGWLLLSLAIERITNAPIEQIMRDRIFAPLGLHDTSLRRHDNAYVGNTAAQHVVNPSGGFERIPWGVDNFLGAGAIVSTVDDLLRWLAHMDAPRIGSQNTWTLIKTPQPLANGFSSGYGLGLILDRYRGVDVIHHPGGAYGGNAQVLKVPSARLDIVVIANRQDANSMLLAQNIVDACLPDLQQGDSPAHESASRGGVFLSPHTGRIIRLFSEDHRQFASINSADLPAYRRDSNNLAVPYIWTSPERQITLHTRGTPIEALTYNYLGNTDELHSVPPMVDVDAEARSIIGHYFCTSSPSLKAHIVADSAGLLLLTTGPFGSAAFSLSGIASHIWEAAPRRHMAPSGGVLAFDLTHSGFSISSMRTYSLPFSRAE